MSGARLSDMLSWHKMSDPYYECLLRRHKHDFSYIFGQMAFLSFSIDDG